MVTFPIYQFSYILSQNIAKKFRGYPLFVDDEKWPPMTAYNPYFSIQNPFLQWKWGMFAKE